MDSGIYLGLRGVLYIYIYMSLLGIYENTYLKPMDRKPRVRGVNKRRILRFPMYYNEVRFYTSDFSSRGRSQGFLRLGEV